MITVFMSRHEKYLVKVRGKIVVELRHEKGCVHRTRDLSLTLTKVLLFSKPNHAQDSGCELQCQSAVVCTSASYPNHLPANCSSHTSIFFSRLLQIASVSQKTNKHMFVCCCHFLPIKPYRP